MARPKKPCILTRNIDEVQSVNCPFGTVRRVLSGQPGAVANFHFVEVTEGRCHLHLNYDEAYYVMKGKGSLYSMGYQWELRPGTVVSIPAGIEHEIITEHNSSILFLVIGTPALRTDDPGFCSVKPNSIHPVPRRKHARLDAFRKVNIYPVVSSEFCNGMPPDEMVQRIADGGAKIVQMREKHMSKIDQIKLGEKIRKITDDYGMLYIVNDHIDVALATGADGVHLGQEDFPIKAAIQAAPQLLFGVSTHSVEEANIAEQAGAGYINIGPIYATKTKSLSMQPLGLDLIQTMSKRLVIPFSVMGGIKMHHIPELKAAGAQRIAMVTEITQAPDPTARVKELIETFKNA